MMNDKFIINTYKDTPYALDLRCYGFRFHEKENAWVKSSIQSQVFINDMEKFCKKRKLDFEIVDANFERNSTYRQDFFDHHQTIHNGYFCSYCGQFFKKEKITVDHIISIAFIKKHKFARKILKTFGLKNINDVSNLTPACKRCNSKKSATIKGWLIRGYLGKFNKLWFPRILLEFVLYFTLFYTVIYGLLNNQFWW